MQRDHISVGLSFSLRVSWLMYTCRREAPAWRMHSLTHRGWLFGQVAQPWLFPTEETQGWASFPGLWKEPCRLEEIRKAWWGLLQRVRRAANHGARCHSLYEVRGSLEEKLIPQKYLICKTLERNPVLVSRDWHHDLSKSLWLSYWFNSTNIPAIN